MSGAVAAFPFMKTMVQTRAKAHTATGTVCYRFGLEATSTLETPVRQWPTEVETRAFDEAEKRRVAAAKAAGEKTRPRRLLPKLIRMDPPRHYDFRGRVGIEASGCALPEGASEAWRGPLEWARRVEAANGHRLDSRQCRDDVLELPIELVRSGFADLAVAHQASKVAELRGTPVHWVIHRPHGAGLNWHAHMVYGGRRLTEDGEAFEARRDIAQDKPELIEAHKALWAETCRELGVEVSFEFPGRAFEADVRREFAEKKHGRELSSEDERAIEIETRRRWKEHRHARASGHELTPRAVRAERTAVAEEEGERLDAVIQGAGGAALTEEDRLEIGRLASAVDELDTRALLALERIPVTTAGRLAKHGLAPEAPVPAPAHRVEPPRPNAAPVVAAAVVPARALARPAPMPGAVAARPTPSPRVETPAAPIRSILESKPVPARRVAALRPSPAPRSSHRVEPPRPEAARIVPVELSPGLRRRAGFDEPLALAPERVLRPPRPVPQAEEALAPSPERQRPVAAAEVVHPAPEPPWRKRVRRLLRTVRDWWPWAPAPPSPGRRVEARLPEQARPVRPAQRKAEVAGHPPAAPSPTPGPRQAPSDERAEKRLRAAVEASLEEMGEEWIRADAGYANAYPSLGDLASSAANAAAKAALRPYVEPFAVPERRKFRPGMKRGEHDRHNAALNRAVERWKHYLAKARTQLAGAVYAAAWPAYRDELRVREAEITKELAAAAERKARATMTFNLPIRTQSTASSKERQPIPPDKDDGRGPGEW